MESPSFGSIAEIGRMEYSFAVLTETGDPKADWQSFWANISFEVR